jgi:small subunit ribosomal protein S1
LEGLLHISELADHKVENPEDVVKVGDEIEVKVLRVDTDERKIGLSRKRVGWDNDDLETENEPETSDGPPSPHKQTVPAATELKGGVGGGSGPLIK